MKISSMLTLGSCALATLGAGLAHAQTPPQQRVGLWREEMVMAGQHVSVQTCVDAASQAANSVFTSSMRKTSKCQTQKLTHNLDGSWTSVSTCEFRKGVVETSQADIKGDFNSKFTMTLRSPPTAPPQMTMSASWVGPCKAGQRGGDVIMSNGQTINMTAGEKGR